jgi:hypothetical protein
LKGCSHFAHVSAGQNTSSRSQSQIVYRLFRAAPLARSRRARSRRQIVCSDVPMRRPNCPADRPGAFAVRRIDWQARQA